MLVKVNPGFKLAGPDGCAGEGKSIELPGEIAAAMVERGYVTPIDGLAVARPPRETRVVEPGENAAVETAADKAGDKAAEPKAKKAAEAKAKKDAEKAAKAGAGD